MKRYLPALAIPALTGLGLVAGLVREVFLAHLFGTTHEIEVFRVAFGLPSILSESLGISFVSVLVPILLAEREIFLLQRPVWITSLLGGLIFLVGVLSMPLQARVLAPGIVGEHRIALISAGALCWGMFLLSVLSLPLRAFMSVNGRLWPGASAALLRSVGFIVALGAMVMAGKELVAGTAAWAALLAGLSVLAIHVVALGVAGRGHVASVLRAGPPKTGSGQLLTALALVFAMQMLLSGGRLLDRMMASTMPAGSLAALEYSYSFLLAVAVVVGTSANILLVPRVGRAFKETGRRGGAGACGGCRSGGSCGTATRYLWSG
jgi:peptidoglycan biosynthesis protein MviN/MurJ (putative lipid II flippase)